MGGKTKNVQRTKDNVKPSSSSRSALLLGGEANSFVGFSAHTNGLKALAPGFATTSEASLETFDGSISADVQVIMRKMSKKDPLTKRKALQEFIALINDSDLEQVKNMLPIWPKFYQSLANDIDYTVRELSQKVLQLIAAKCKRAIAPLLKQLVPVWVSTRFDNYAPAASIAASSFNETFISNTDRTQEVCLHCQSEIVEYATRNITFHTSATLSNGKNLTAEEAEQKYQRLMMCSLKLLSFLIEHNTAATGDDLQKLRDGLLAVWTHPKFWSFSKHKLNSIRAAWFELAYQLLQNEQLREVVTTKKSELIGICFQNLNDSDTLAAPFIWACILLIQRIFPDWHTAVDVQKVVLTKLSQLIRSGFSRNAAAICSHILPFIANLSQEHLNDVELNEFYKRFFDDFRSSVQVTVDISSRSDYTIITKTYFECLRYVLQRINNNSEGGADFGVELFEANVLAAIDWSLTTKANIPFKCFYHHLSSLIVFVASAGPIKDPGGLYGRLYKAFWAKIDHVLAEEIDKANVESRNTIKHLIDLVQELSSASANHSHHNDKNVKFASTESSPNKTNELKCNMPPVESQPSSNATRQQLKPIVVKLLRTCLDRAKSSQQGDAEAIQFLRALTPLYTDRSFYTEISGQSLVATLDMFAALAARQEEPLAASTESNDILLDIIFEMLEKSPKSEQFDYITNNLLQLQSPPLQISVLQRLTSHPFCLAPETRTLLAQPVCCDILRCVAQQVVSGERKEHLNILHKCFFQTPEGDILISQPTVDQILNIVSEGFANGEHNEMTDTLGSFVAQIMPTVCSDENASEQAKYDVFLRLFKFSVANEENDYISEDTLWEMATCWQDALSAGDIRVNNELLHNCATFIEQCAGQPAISVSRIGRMSAAISQFILCVMQSTGNADSEAPSSSSAATNCAAQTNSLLETFFTSSAFTGVSIRQFGEFCLFVEALKDEVTVGIDINSKAALNINALEPLAMHALLYLDAILMLVTQQNDENEDPNCRVVSANEDFSQWSEFLCVKIMECLQVAAMATADSIAAMSPSGSNLSAISAELLTKVVTFMAIPSENIPRIKERLLEEAVRQTDPNVCRSLGFLVYCEQYALFEENATILLFEELSEFFVTKKAFKAYANCLQYLLPKLAAKSFTPQSAIMHEEPKELWIRAVVFRCLIQNNFSAAMLSEKGDHVITAMTLQYITEIAEKQSSQTNILLYNVDINQQQHLDVVNATEFAKLLVAVLENFPHEMTIKNWDAVRLALSSWVLSVSKSIQNHTNPKVALMTVTAFQLFAALIRFINVEKQKSSTTLLASVIDEWDNVFARDVNLVLFKTFYTLCSMDDIPESYRVCYNILLNEITPALEYIDFSIVFTFYKNSTTITLDNVNNLLLKNLSHRMHGIRLVSAFILRQLTRFFVAEDCTALDKTSNESFSSQNQAMKWHHLNRFEDYLTRYESLINKYVQQFSFKLTEINEFEAVPRDDAISFLLLWDCILFTCANSPITLRSTYTNWLQDNKYEETFLRFLFRCMPAEILKNHDSKIMSPEIFKGLTWSQMKDDNLPLDKYACHLYTETLRKLPAVVRRWWSTSPSRQKTFVDKLTTNFVSLLICNEELRAISNKKERHENMQVSVHMSTREVLAVYSIDEARMELVITLAHNYPLGGVKVECGKQIGGRSNSRNIGMQLTIFLTHQNGTIIDGLTLWKNNLDKKFEGVEECYVCYTVIHQETCQLPKLCCKTCKKKFHGPCLYKWFTTSSKSTCPICRNVF